MSGKLSVFNFHKAEVKKLIENEVSLYKSPVEKEQAFLKWALKNVFFKTETDFSIVNTPHDLGIDAFFELDIEDVWIIRSRYGASHSMEAVNQFSKDFYDFKSIEIDNLDAKLRVLGKLIRDGRKAILVYVTNNEASEDEKHNALELSMTIFDISEITYEMFYRNEEYGEAADFIG